MSPKRTNDHGEPYCDDCGMLQPAGTDMVEIQMGAEPDVWVCPECDRQMQKELEMML